MGGVRQKMSPLLLLFPGQSVFGLGEGAQGKDCLTQLRLPAQTAEN